LHSFKKYILSIVFSFLVTLILLAVLSVVFNFFPPAPWILNTVSGYSYTFTAFLSAFLSSRALRKRGLLTGLFTSFLCIFLLSLAGTVFIDGTRFFHPLLKNIITIVLCGALGGILGINSK